MHVVTQAGKALKIPFLASGGVGCGEQMVSTSFHYTLVPAFRCVFGSHHVSFHYTLVPAFRCVFVSHHVSLHYTLVPAFRCVFGSHYVSFQYTLVPARCHSDVCSAVVMPQCDVDQRIVVPFCRLCSFMSSSLRAWVLWPCLQPILGSNHRS